MAYICVRPMTLMGNQYWPGDVIAPEHIVPGREKAMKANGRITEVDSPDTAAPTPTTGIVIIAVPVIGADGEDITLQMTGEDVANAIRILQLNAEKATRAIKAVEVEDVLILIHALETRASVKKAAETQADKLSNQ